MRKIIVLIMFALALPLALHAQVAPGMKYGELKEIYNPKEYVPQYTDPYSRGWAGVASLVIPGLGQIICGEYGRGAAFLAGNIALNTLYITSSKRFRESVTVDSSGNVTGYKNESAARSSSGVVLGSLAAGVALNIWSIVDAVRVAKVKNMYFQDLGGRRSSVEMNVEPYFGNAMQPAAGLTLAFTIH